MGKFKRLPHTDYERKEEKNVTGMMTKLSLATNSHVSGTESKAGLSNETTTAFATYILNSSAIQKNIDVTTNTSTLSQKENAADFYTNDVTSRDDFTKSYEQTDVKTVSDARQNLKTEAESTQKDAISPEEKGNLENEVSTKLKDTLKESLGISEDEMEEAMEKLGLSGLDLLNPTNLTALVSELTDVSDATELLVSSSMQDLLKTTQELANAISEATGLTVSQLTEQWGMDTARDSLDESFLQNLQGESKAEGVKEDATKNPALFGEMTISDEMFASAASDFKGSEIPLQTASLETNADMDSVQGLQENGQNTDHALDVMTNASPAANQNMQTSENAFSTEPLSGQDAGSDESKTLKETALGEQNGISSETASPDETDGKTVLTENGGTSDDNDRANEQASKDDTRSLLWETKDQRANVTATVGNSMAQQSFTSSLENAVFGGQTQSTSTSYVDANELMQQVVDFAKLHVKEDTTSLEMQLNPEKLGKLMIHVSEKAGEVTAEIKTQNEVVKEALESQIATLKTSLEGQGVKVNAVEITVASHAFEENLDKQADAGTEQNKEQEHAQNQSTRKNLIVSELDDLTGLLSEEEMLVAQIMKDHGNSVDMMV